MDFEKYKTALDDLPESIIGKYFNKDKISFAKAKIQLLDKFANDDYQYQPRSSPFITNYFRIAFLRLCRNLPYFVGSVLFLNTMENKYLIPDISNIKNSNKNTINWNGPLLETVSSAEQVFLEAREQILSWKKNPEKDEEHMLAVQKKIEILSKAKIYNDIRRIYYLLYLELDLNLLCFNKYRVFIKPSRSPKDWYKLRKTRDIPILKKVVNNKSYRNKKYIHYTDLTIYRVMGGIPRKKRNKIEELNKIIMIPYPKKTSNNVIILNKKIYEEVKNSPFDFLYYLLWLRKEIPEQNTRFDFGGIILEEHISKMTNNDNNLNRFRASWNADNVRMKNEKSKIVGMINDNIFKTIFNYKYDIITNDGKSYILTNKIQPEIITLVSFQTNI